MERIKELKAYKGGGREVNEKEKKRKMKTVNKYVNVSEN